MTLTMILLVLVSFVAGFIDSIAGGGGLIQIPALLLGGLSSQTALAANKFIASMGTAAALANFIRGKKVIWKIAAAGIVFAMGGSFLGARTILMMDPALVTKIIVFLLPIGIAITLLPKKNLHEEKKEFSKNDLFIKVPILCSLIGFYNGFFGPGTGTLLVLALHWFLGMNLVHASATSKVFNLVSDLSALILFTIGGKVMYMFLLPLAGASIFGGYLGSHLTIKKGAGMVKLFLGISLGILFISLVVKVLN